MTEQWKGRGLATSLSLAAGSAIALSGLPTAAMASEFPSQQSDANASRVAELSIPSLLARDLGVLSDVTTSAWANAPVTDSSSMSLRDRLNAVSLLNDAEPQHWLSRLTAVSELSDVRPTDWAFTALQSLVERYGCIAGYPPAATPTPRRLKEGGAALYRGQQTLSRYEFAAGLNACLDKINEILSAGLADKVSKDDLATLQKLQEEFAAELAALRGRVDALEAKTTLLEAQQFSTTTRLNGLAFVNITGASAGGAVRREVGARDPRTGQPLTALANNPNVTMSNLVWLNFLTSFTGKDLLVTQLVAGNGNSPANAFGSAGFQNTWGTPFTDQTAAGAGANTFAIQEFSYQFPLFNDRTLLKVGPKIIWYRLFDTNRFTLFLNGSSTFNAINSTLSSPVKHGAGAVLLSSLTDWLELGVGYLAESNTFLPGPGSAAKPQEGLFGGTNIFTAQLAFKPSQDATLRLIYSRANQQPTPFGTVGGLAPINGFADDGFGGGLNNAQSDIFIANFDWLLTKGFGLFGRYSFSNTNLNPANPARAKGSLSATAFQVGLAFPDLFKEGALGTISFGMPFNYTSGRNFLVSGGGDGGNQYDLELSYFLPLTRNLAIAPNFYAIFNPNNFSSNPTVYVANLRLQFAF